MLSLINATLRSLSLYLQLRNTTAAYDLRRKIENDIETDETEITRLRAIPSTDAQLAATRLRDRVTRTQGIASNLPTQIPLPESWQPNSND